MNTTSATIAGVTVGNLEPTTSSSDPAVATTSPGTNVTETVTKPSMEPKAAELPTTTPLPSVTTPSTNVTTATTTTINTETSELTKAQTNATILSDPSTDNSTEAFILSVSSTELPFNSTFDNSTEAFVTAVNSTELPLFNNETGTDISYYDTGNSTSNSTDDEYYYYYYDDEEDSINPFLANDYDWYAYNELGSEIVLDDYTSAERLENKIKTDAQWKNVEVPPSPLPISFVAYDLQPYFLVGPPLAVMILTFFIFLPCVLLKIRDDIRERNGKPRLYYYGSKRKRKDSTNTFKETYLSIDNEWKTVEVKAGTSKPADTKANSSIAAGSSNSDPATATSSTAPSHFKQVNETERAQGTTPTPHHSKDYILDVKASPVSSSATTKTLSDEGCTEMAPSESSNSPTEMDSCSSDEAISLGATDKPQEDKELSKPSTGDGGIEENFSTAVPTSSTAFPGWNKDLYSNGTGFGPPARKSSSPNSNIPNSANDPECGLY